MWVSNHGVLDYIENVIKDLKVLRHTLNESEAGVINGDGKRRFAIWGRRGN